MDEQEFRKRTKAISLRAIKVIEALPKTTTGEVLGRQLVRAATSVGANYRAAGRAKSEADMVAKLGVVEEEADETLYWLELIVEAGLIPESRLADLMNEVDEIISMTVSSIRTLRQKRTKS